MSPITSTMDRLLVIESFAIAVGLIVIGIETFIIYLLKKHMRILKIESKKNEMLMKEFKNGVNNHLDHLNSHSHEIEEKITTLFHDICIPVNAFEDREQQNIKDKTKKKAKSVVKST